MNKKINLLNWTQNVTEKMNDCDGENIFIFLFWKTYGKQQAGRRQTVGGHINLSERT